jgi:uncharacterized protein YbjT (DUF2867 family)
VKCSAIGADTRESTFPRLHRDVEERIEAYGIPYTFLRPNSFMQNMLMQAGSIRAHGAFYGAMDNARASYVDVRDVAAVAAAVLTTSGHERKAYSLTGPEALTQNEMAAQLSQATGRTIKYVDLPSMAMKLGMMSTGIDPWTTDAILDLQRVYREGKWNEVSPDVERLTGRPAGAFAQFTRDYADQFKPAVAAV